jgi:hypothetical protein
MNFLKSAQPCQGRGGLWFYDHATSGQYFQCLLNMKQTGLEKTYMMSPARQQESTPSPLVKKEINFHVILKTVLFTLFHNRCLDWRSAEINFNSAKSKRRKGFVKCAVLGCCQHWKQEKT